MSEQAQVCMGVGSEPGPEQTATPGGEGRWACGPQAGGQAPLQQHTKSCFSDTVRPSPRPRPVTYLRAKDSFSSEGNQLPGRHRLWPWVLGSF